MWISCTFPCGSREEEEKGVREGGERGKRERSEGESKGFLGPRKGDGAKVTCNL
jgi:hypothetical protein